MASVLSDVAIKAAQALSEKFGIPTFNLYGGIQTVPTTRPSDPNINVGTGSTGLSISSFNALISALSPQKPTIPTQTVYSPQAGVTTQPITTHLTPQETIIQDVPKNQKSIGDSITTTLQKYQGPLFLGGVAILGIMLLKGK